MLGVLGTDAGFPVRWGPAEVLRALAGSLQPALLGAESLGFPSTRGLPARSKALSRLLRAEILAASGRTDAKASISGSACGQIRLTLELHRGIPKAKRDCKSSVGAARTTAVATIRADLPGRWHTASRPGGRKLQQRDRPDSQRDRLAWIRSQVLSGRGALSRPH